MKKYQCPCCECFTYNVPPKEDCGYICPVCFWENDPFITSDSDPSDLNHGITLNEAKNNYLEFGACERKMLRYVPYCGCSLVGYRPIPKECPKCHKKFE